MRSGKTLTSEQRTNTCNESQKLRPHFSDLAKRLQQLRSLNILPGEYIFFYHKTLGDTTLQFGCKASVPFPHYFIVLHVHHERKWNPLYAIMLTDFHRKPSCRSETARSAVSFEI